LENQKNESQILGVSLRGWLALMIVFTVCAMSSWGADIKEPLYSMVLISIGYYYGQKKTNNEGK
jgi:uncharacterized membrane protein YhaH (DUF805 family)